MVYKEGRPSKQMENYLRDNCLCAKLEGCGSLSTISWTWVSDGKARILMCFLDGSVGIYFFVGGSVKGVFLPFAMQLWGCGMSFRTKSQEKLEI